MSDVVQVVERATAALRDLRKKKSIDIAVYGKKLVQLSTLYVRANMPREALELVRSVPLEYYTEHQLGQILSDPEYAADANEVAVALAAAGLLEQKPLIHVNVPAGSA